MRVPQKTDYALRAVIELARLPRGTTVAAGEIADRLGLPRRFVEQQVTQMAKHGITSCQRGPRGGCALARPAEEISVADVVRAVQGTIVDVPLAGGAAAETWKSMAAAVTGYLESVSLVELVERQATIDGAPIYYI
ncbi:MAG: Rrf2 family transcriptional regulator [Actinomycetota bacterium]|jgi:Rrf2 family protein|nr:Rrf2 family transcriptional regulator [Actinomycetota bacterium]MDZ4180878.1 Rrf2 family transcriptional regulator [Coriobacteriia bacterium]